MSIRSKVKYHLCLHIIINLKIPNIVWVLTSHTSTPPFQWRTADVSLYCHFMPLIKCVFGSPFTVCPRTRFCLLTYAMPIKWILIKLFSHTYDCCTFLMLYIALMFFLFRLLFQLNSTEPQPVPAFLPAHLNNKPICDDIIRKFSPSRRLESRELAKLLAQPHFRVNIDKINGYTILKYVEIRICANIIYQVISAKFWVLFFLFIFFKYYRDKIHTTCSLCDVDYAFIKSRFVCGEKLENLGGLNSYILRKPIFIRWKTSWSSSYIYSFSLLYSYADIM